MARKNTFSMDNMGQWPKLFKKLPARQQQAVYMMFACVLVFLIVVIASTMLIFGGKKDNKEPDTSGLTSSSVNNVDSGYNKDAESIDVDKYAGVLLPSSSDAGQSYLDDTLFVGDSNTVRLHDVYKLIPLKNYMGMVGMTIQGAVSAPCVFFENDVTVYTIPKAIAKAQPRRILMCFGTNNADGNTSVEAFIKHYKAAIKEIQAAYEYADIIITAIPPCGLERDYPNVSQKTIDEFNKALVNMCEDMGLKFLNTAEVLKDSSTGYIKTSYISGDGLHLNDAGDKAWIEYVRTHAYLTEDKRPPLKDIPVRQEPPAPVAGTPVAPTCTTNGYTPYTLWNGTVDKRDIVLELGHDYKNGICTRCAEKDPNYKAPSSSSSSSSSSSHVHNYATKGAVVAPTCTVEGYTPYTCACGAVEQREKVGALGHHYVNGVCDRAGCGTKDPNSSTSHTHTFGDWQTTQAATCEAAGQQIRKCTGAGCTATETQAINATGHAWSGWNVTTAPTCDAEGSQTRTCSVCNKSETQTIAKNAHVWDAGVETVPPTTDVEGVRTFTCTLCKATRTEVIQKLPPPTA